MYSKIFFDRPDENTLDQWREFLVVAKRPSQYCTPHFFSDPFVNGRRFALLVFNENKDIDAVLTGSVSQKRVVVGLASRPQLAFRKGADTALVTRELGHCLIENFGRIEEWIKVYAWEPISFGASFKPMRRDAENEVAIIDLADGTDKIFRNFSQTKRNEIRKAEKQNLLEIKEVENDAELAELYEIHLDWNRQKSTNPDAFENFIAASRQADSRKIFIAKHCGKVIAGSFFRFCRGGLVEYAANNSLREHQHLRPNEMILWHAIRWACGSGFSHFSMGGAHPFLRRFGGEIVTTYGYSLDTTFLRRHERYAMLRDQMATVFRSLPQPIRRKIKKSVANS